MGICLVLAASKPHGSIRCRKVEGKNMAVSGVPSLQWKSGAKWQNSRSTPYRPPLLPLDTCIGVDAQ